MALCAAAAAPAAAQEDLKIVAVVNDDVITGLDLFQRLRLAMIATQSTDSPEARERLIPTVLRALVDERLKAQEARRQNVQVPEGEIEEWFEALAARNRVSSEDFAAGMAAAGVGKETMLEQRRIEVGWVLAVRRRFADEVQITDKDIAQERRRMAAAEGQSEYRLQQIFLPVAGDEAGMRRAAEQIVRQVQGGADFAALAAQFSQDQSAAGGGDLGWVRPDQLDAAVAAALPSLAKDAVSPPLRGAGGYYILRLLDSRLAGGDVDHGGAAPSSDDIARRLAGRRLETLARGLLADLRRAAVIDIRL